MAARPPLGAGRGPVWRPGAAVAGIHPLDYDPVGGTAVRAPGHCQRAYAVGYTSVGAGGHRRADGHSGGAGGRGDPQPLAGTGGVGLLWDVGQPLGAGVPAVYGPVVHPSRAGHRGI